MAVVIFHCSRSRCPARLKPSENKANGAASSPSQLKGVSTMSGSVQPLKPMTVPLRMPMISGFFKTLTKVLPKPLGVGLPCFAHSTDTVTKVHSVSELNTSTGATVGNAASPRAMRASGMPSMALLEKMPASAKTDWLTPSSRNTRQASRRPMTNTMRQLPKKAIRARLSTGGSCDSPHIITNSRAGKAAENTKRANQMLTLFGHFSRR